MCVVACIYRPDPGYISTVLSTLADASANGSGLLGSFGLVWALRATHTYGWIGWSRILVCVCLPVGLGME